MIVGFFDQTREREQLHNQIFDYFRSKNVLERLYEFFQGLEETGQLFDELFFVEDDFDVLSEVVVDFLGLCLPVADLLWRDGFDLGSCGGYEEKSSVSDLDVVVFAFINRFSIQNGRLSIDSCFSFKTAERACYSTNPACALTVLTGQVGYHVLNYCHEGVEKRSQVSELAPF